MKRSDLGITVIDLYTTAYSQVIYSNREEPEPSAIQAMQAYAIRSLLEIDQRQQFACTEKVRYGTAAVAHHCG